MTTRPPSPPKPRPALLFTGLLLATVCGGCNYIRNLGSGTHMDAPPAHVAETDHRVRDMIVEVTTDAAGEIADIHFTRSSGKDGIDNYVAQTIREGWPRQPSIHTQVEVTYSPEKGFSQPKVLSSSPAA